MIQRFIILSAALFYPAFLVFGQDAGQSFSLQEAQQHALAHNKEVVNAALDVDAAKKKIWETTAIGLPQVTAEGTYTHIFEVPTLQLGPEPVEVGTANSATYKLSLSQLIFSGEYIVGVQASKTYKRFADEGLEGKKVDIKETVANSYFTALVMEENLRLLDTSLALVAQVDKEMQAMAKVGFAESTDADQMTLNLATLKNQRMQIERMESFSKRILKFNMGIDLDSSITLSQDLDALIAGTNLEADTTTFSLEDHIQYRMLQTNEDLMQLNLKRYQSAYLPTVAGFYQHKGYGKEPEVNFEPADVAGITISLPLFTSGARHSRIQQAKIEHVKAQNTKEQASEGLRVAVDQAESDFINALNVFETEQGNMQLAERIFRNYLTKQKNGMASSLDVTNAQNQYIGTQTKYFTAMFEVLRLRVALDKAKGTL